MSKALPELRPDLFDVNLHPNCRVDQNDKETFLQRREKYWATASMAGCLLWVPHSNWTLSRFLKVKQGFAEPPTMSDYAREHFAQPGIDAEPFTKHAFVTAVGEFYPGLYVALWEVGTYDVEVEGKLLGASPDGLLQVGEEVWNVELKYNASKTEPSNVPLYYWVQMQMQMLATNTQRTYYVATCAGSQVTVATVERSQVFLELLEAQIFVIGKILEGTAETKDLQPKKKVEPKLQAELSKVQQVFGDTMGECLQKLHGGFRKRKDFY